MELPNTNIALTYSTAPRPPLAHGLGAEPSFPPRSDTHQPQHQASQLGSSKEAASLKHPPLFSFPDRRLVFEPSAHIPEEDILLTHRTDAPRVGMLPKQTAPCQHLLTLVLWGHLWLSRQPFWHRLMMLPSRAGGSCYVDAPKRESESRSLRAPEHSEDPQGDPRRAGVLGQGASGPGPVMWF